MGDMEYIKGAIWFFAFIFYFFGGGKGGFFWGGGWGNWGLGILMF